VDWTTLLSILIGALVTWVVAKWYYERAGRDLKEEAASLRQETEKVRHNSRATITWLKEAGLINPRVDPDTGEYLDIVGSQVEVRHDVEATPDDNKQSDDVEDQPST
jgi:hypothetical protein